MLEIPDKNKRVMSRTAQKQDLKSKTDSGTEQKQAPVLPSIGRIKLGKKTERGYPTRLNYINITSEVPDGPMPFTLKHYRTSLIKINQVLAPEHKNPENLVNRIYGLLPYEDPYKNIYIYRGVYRKSGPVCTSTMIKNLFTDSSKIPIKGYYRKGDQTVERECSPKCPMRDQCKIHGIFRMYPVVVKYNSETSQLEFPTAYIGSVLILRTTSWSIIRDLIGGMQALKEALGGLTGYVVQLDLVRKQLGDHFVNSLAISAQLPLHRFSYKSLRYDITSLISSAEDSDEEVNADVETSQQEPQE
jgi:hypothetical protein